MEEIRGSSRLYSLDEAARQLGISVWTIRAHAKRGGALRTTRVGRRVLVSATELARIEASGLPSLTVPKPASAATRTPKAPVGTRANLAQAST